MFFFLLRQRSSWNAFQCISKLNVQTGRTEPPAASTTGTKSHKTGRRTPADRPTHAASHLPLANTLPLATPNLTVCRCRSLSSLSRAEPDLDRANPAERFPDQAPPSKRRSTQWQSPLTGCSPRARDPSDDGGGDPRDGPARRCVGLGGVLYSGGGVGLSPEPQRRSPDREGGHARPREHQGLRPQPHQADHPLP